MGFMREIRKADFLYVADVDGYVGQSAATEMAYARLKNLPVVVAEEVKTFSNEIPAEMHEFLRQGIIEILAVENISKETVAEVKTKIGTQLPPELTEDGKRKLFSLVKRLLKDLKYF
jgi:hypothetical protein